MGSYLTKNLVIQGFSLVLMQHNESVFLVAFGGSKKEPSNQVGEVLVSIFCKL